MIVIGNTGDVRVVADYAVAQRVLEAGVLVWQTVGFALLGRMGRGFAAGQEGGRRLVGRLAGLASLGGGLVGFVLVAAMPLLMDFVFGTEYRGATRSAQIFAGSFPVIAAFFVLWYGATAARADRRRSRR